MEHQERLFGDPLIAYYQSGRRPSATRDRGLSQGAKQIDDRPSVRDEGFSTNNCIETPRSTSQPTMNSKDSAPALITDMNKKMLRGPEADRLKATLIRNKYHATYILLRV